MLDNLKHEIISLSKLLLSSEYVDNVDVNSQDEIVTITIFTKINNELNWSVLLSIFTQYFYQVYNSTVQFDIKTDVGTQKTGMPRQPAAKPKSQDKKLGNQIAVYETENHDWRLFRYRRYTHEKTDENYFAPSEAIARIETANLDRAFLFASKDLKSKKVSRNVIELNINCLIDSSLRNDYLFSLRQLPRQLRNRFAISLVRISDHISAYDLKQAATICKLCTDDLFLSLPYNSNCSLEHWGNIFQASGYIITIGQSELQNITNVRHVYDKVNSHFRGKNVFLIFDEVKIREKFSAFRNIKLLQEKDKIYLDN